jgi:glycosyltransferase involved in cell wall biosynthesis
MKVSIGIPVFNARPFLANAVRSVFAQTYQDWELIILDDGSADGSLEVARSIREPRVSVYSDGTNQGLPSRLNEIAKLARGQYLARMDADDLMHPQRLAEQVRFLDEHACVDLVDTAIYSMNAANVPVGIRGREPLRPTGASIIRRGLLSHPAVLGRREWFLRNPYDPSCLRCEDRELWCRAFQHSQFGRVPVPLHYYREVVNLQNYMRSCADERRLLRIHGPRLVGRWKTWYYLIRTWMKGAVYRLFAALDATSVLVARRNRPLDAIDAAAAQEGLWRILTTPVPGLTP